MTCYKCGQLAGWECRECGRYACRQHSTLRVRDKATCRKCELELWLRGRSGREDEPLETLVEETIRRLETEVVRAVMAAEGWRQQDVDTVREAVRLLKEAV